jgi:hypothetical protein
MTRRFLTMTLSTAMGLTLAAAAPARAQSNAWANGPAAYANDDYRAPYADTQRAAYDNGYRDGLKRGEQAARDRRPLDIERERDYRNAEAGYNRSHGDRNRYRDSYRGGFAQGYREGYQRRGVYSNNGYPTNGYPTNGYPTNGYPTNGYPTNGYPTNGYPTNGYPTNGYPNDGRDYGRNRGYGGTASYGAYQNGASDGYSKGLDDLNHRKSPDVNRQKWYRSADHDYDNRYGSKEAYRVEYRRGFQEGYNRAYREGRRY